MKRYFQHVPNVLWAFIVLLLVCLLRWAWSASPLNDILPGQWWSAPQSTLGPVFAPYHHGTGIPGVLTESSGIYDAARQRLCVHGGGHTDDADNSVYCFSLVTLTWERLATPVPFSTDDTDLFLSTGYYPGANALPDTQAPRSVHTYNDLVYIPPLKDALCRMGAFSPWKGSGKLLNVDCLSLTTLHWTQQAFLPGPVPIEYANSAAYDPGTQHVFFHSPSGKLLEFDPQANTWTARSVGLPRVMDQTMLVDTTRRRLVFAGGGKLYSIDLIQTGNMTMRDMTSVMTGDVALLGGRRPGFVHDTEQDVYTFYSSDVHAPGDVAVIDPDRWVMKKVSYAGSGMVPEPCVKQGNPPVKCNSTYGKFQVLGNNLYSYIPTSLTQPVWFYKIDAAEVALALGRLSAPTHLRIESP